MKITQIVAFIIILFSLVGYTPDVFGQWQWAKGSKNPDRVCEGYPVAVDALGNVYTCTQIDNFSGTFGATITVWGTDTIHNAGYYQLIIASTDSSGAYRWALGTQNNSAFVVGMAADDCGHLYVYGIYNWPIIVLGGDTLNNPYPDNGMYFLAQLNTNGTVNWLRNIGPQSTVSTVAETYPGGVCTDKQGNVYVSGIYNGSSVHVGSTTLTNSSPDTNSCDIFVAKYSSSGTPLWARSFGGDSSDFNLCMAASRNGDVYIGGYYFSHYIALAGDTVFNPDGTANQYLFLAKYDTYGSPKWIKGSKGRVMDNVNALATDVWGNVYMVGGYFDTIAFGSVSLPVNTTTVPYDFLFKFDSTGNARWARSVTGASEDIYGFGVAADNCGNIWMSIGGEGTPAETLVLAEYDTSGAFMSSTTQGFGGDDMSSLAVDNRGGLYIGGDFMGSPHVVGGDTLVASDSAAESMFIAKFSYPMSVCVLDTLPHITICTGASDSLEGSFLCGYWTSSNSSVAAVGSLTGVVTGISAGTATVTHSTAAEGFETLQVTVLPSPDKITGSKNICLDSSVTLADSTTGGGWTSSNTVVATVGSATGVVHALSAGVAVILYTGSNGCTAIDSVTIRKCALGVPLTRSPSDILMYPNPAGSELNISAPGPINDLEITNSIGQAVIKAQYSTNAITADIGMLRPGIYIARVNSTVIGKFVKE